MTTIFHSKPRMGRLGLALSAGAAVASIAIGSPAVHADPDTVQQSGPTTVRRLSEDQYKRSIAQIFGADINVPGRFEPPVREEGLLAIGQSHVIVTPAGFEQYALRGREISAQVLDEKHRGLFLQCAPQAGFDEACAKQFFGKYGRMLFRRPLKDSEMAATLKLARSAAASTGSFDGGMRAGLASMLMSPAFVFRMETSEPDPDLPAVNRLDAYSLASRVSFLLWDAPPDAQLLDSAADGSLHNPAVLQREVDRMLASPHIEEGVRAFFSDMFAYDQFEGLSKDSKIYPIFNPQLRDDAREQSLRTVVDLLLTQEGDYRDLFTTRKTFLTRSLGALYGVRVDARAFGGWMPYTIPASSPYSGILTMPAFLMLDPSHEGRSSPTIRGKMVRENLLCQPVPAPPANVNFNLVQDVNDPVRKTARERLMAHQDNPVCSGCHAITDPIGLSLENYTPVGSFRAKENGVEIDASGEFEGKPYKNALELMNYLRNGPTAASCVVQRVAEYGVGRKLSPGEENWVGNVDERFGKNGYRFKALLRDVATSPTFQAVARPTLAAK
jgi:hypothetical protein